MILGGKRLLGEKKHLQIFEILTIWMVWFLILFELSTISRANAAPIIIDDQSGGSWYDNFIDEEGIEACLDLTIADKGVSLSYSLNETKWDKEGVAVAKGGVHDLLFAHSPSVMIDNGIYKMWYVGWNGINQKIMYATSTDGIDWEKNPFNPVLRPGYPGDPDDIDVADPKVIKDDGIYKMWYSGNDSNYDRIMYAESDDGITWTKHGVVLEDLGARPDTIMKDGITYKMWYQNFDDGHYKIYHAISQDGLNWTKQGLVLDISDPGELDDFHVSGATVLKEDDNTYKMWYSGHYGNETYRLFYATSHNGINWIKQGLALDIGNSGDKEESGVSYPCVIKEVNRPYRMWYSGNVNRYEMNVMYAVSQVSIKEYGSLISEKISLPSIRTWKDLVIDKTDDDGGSHLYISILDGATNRLILGFENLSVSNFDISSIDNTIHPTIRLQAIFLGDGSSTPVLNEWSVTWINPQASSPSSFVIPTENDLWARAIFVVSMGVVLFSITFAGGTEVGRYRLYPVIFPLYSRLKREELLDQLTRNKIYEYIMGHPGDNYNSIRQELNLNNGVLAYHLRMLEKEDYIKSMRDGIYKRFYPMDVKVQMVNGFGTRSVQGKIIMHLLQNPELTQKDISKALGISQQVVSYHLTLMVKTGHVRAEREGKVYRYYVDELIFRGNV